MKVRTYPGLPFHRGKVEVKILGILPKVKALITLWLGGIYVPASHGEVSDFFHLFDSDTRRYCSGCMSRRWLDKLYRVDTGG